MLKSYNLQQLQERTKVEAEQKKRDLSEEQFKGVPHNLNLARRAIAVDFSIERRHKGWRMGNGRQFPER